MRQTFCGLFLCLISAVAHNHARAGHVVHHSSQYYNIFTALRQSTFHMFFCWVFYLPAALFMTPTAFVIHGQFNMLYQFWIHTETIPKLGWLEYVLNTPSHHRVHHGANRYCIDKNYGGTLIIWDRLFGTFAEEGEEVVYGLTHNINTFNPWTIQTHQFARIWDMVASLPGLGNKLSAVFKGPGWLPGKPRLGDPDDIPDIQAPMPQYTNSLPVRQMAYVVAHTVITTMMVTQIQHVMKSLTPVEVAFSVAFIWSSFLSTGYTFNRSPHAALFEFHRCAVAAVAFLYIWQTKLVRTELLLFGRTGVLDEDVNLILGIMCGVSGLLIKHLGPWMPVKVE